MLLPISARSKTLIAGADTMSTTMTWLLYTLTTTPLVLNKLRQSLEQAANNPITSTEPDYLQMCIDETQRLFPPIWGMLRKSTETTEFCGITIESGHHIILSPYTLHRHPAYWPAPHQFNPENFCRKHREMRPKNSYIPYGTGRRICIGKNSSLTHL